MRIGVIGSGMVGQTLAGRLAELGHEVVIGTRDVQASTDAPDSPLRAWATEHPAVRVATFTDTAAHGELVIAATSGAHTLAALELAGAQQLRGKVLLDVTNPLDFSRGMPPTLLVKDDDSLAEQIQRAFPETHVVKSLNTVNASVMVHPEQVAGGEHTVFVSGDDERAKQVVVALLEGFGWRDVLDLGDLSTARGTEMLLPLWVRLYGRLGSPAFNFRVVR